MKTIDSIIMVTLIMFLGVTSIFYVVDDISNTSGLTFDEESTNLINEYNSAYNDFDNNLTFTTYNESGLPNYEGIDPEFKEAAESKGIIETFEDLWDSIYTFPTIMMASLPFLDLESSEFIIKIILVCLGVITMYGVIALYKAWKTGGAD